MLVYFAKETGLSNVARLSLTISEFSRTTGLLGAQDAKELENFINTLEQPNLN